ncbi:MAG: molybdopterin oxidoreductase family protein [Acidobacteria bacterium]|nr:molybdopterin oxidoreductase family protein [Acidobacteriota bacterium]MBI3421535.1 molybdopterin oxidoreductase family protein [Acidobacteriota bacterium]
MSSRELQVIRGACPHDCPDTCALEITVENGVAIKVAGAADHPTTNGFLCTKVNRYLERTYSPQRVLYPMKRVGAKGKGLFARITWDEALDTIAAKFKEIAADNPQAILPYSYAGTMGLIQGESMDRRFFHQLGASLLDRTICASAGSAGYSATLGLRLGTDMERFDEAKLILIWGSNPITSNVHLWPKIVEAKRRGARVIAIDPYRSLTAEKCDEHLALLPGTDAALALAMMHVLIKEDLLDHDYIQQYTHGFELLRERALEWAPARAAEITGLSTDQIIKLAREYGTTKPAVIRLNYGMQRHAGGGMAVRTVTCLPALVGAWRDAAGGVLLSSSSTFVMNTNALQRPDLIWNQPRTINMSALGDALLGYQRIQYRAREQAARLSVALDEKLEPLVPPIKAIYVYNSNPAAVAPDSRKVIAGFQREDLFCVVHEIFQTDTADYADILLPATTQLEQFDLHRAYGHMYVLVNNPAIAPLGEAKPNTEVFRLLAARLGFTDECFRDSDEEMARQALQSEHERMQGINLDELKAKGWQRLNVPERYAPFAEGNFPTPSGKCEFFSEALAKQGHDPLPTYIAPRESVLDAPVLARQYPLAVISPPAHNFLNSSFANLPSFLKAEKEPWLDIHPTDAAARNIADGDRVRIFNDRGAFTATARVTDKARRGVVVALSVWWKKLTRDGTNANDVTGQGLTDLGAAATFYDALVEVAKA